MQFTTAKRTDDSSLSDAGDTRLFNDDKDEAFLCSIHRALQRGAIQYESVSGTKPIDGCWPWPYFGILWTRLPVG